MCVLSFCASLGWNIFHSKKKWARCDRKCILVFVSSTRNSYQIVMKLEYSGPVSKIIFKYQMSWKPVRWDPRCSVRADRRTARHDEANSRFSQFCERAEKCKHEEINIVRVEGSCNSPFPSVILYWCLISLLMPLLSLFYSYVAVCTVRSVQHVPRYYLLLFIIL